MRGGIDVTPVLGSRSYDVMSAIGPLPLQPGDVLPIGEHTDEYPELDQAPVAPIAERAGRTAVVPGPRDDWFVDPDALVHTIWMASDRSDRVGMRLERHAAAVPLARTASCPARAPPAARSRCRPTDYR